MFLSSCPSPHRHRLPCSRPVTRPGKITPCGRTSSDYPSTPIFLLFRRRRITLRRLSSSCLDVVGLPFDALLPPHCWVAPAGHRPFFARSRFACRARPLGYLPRGYAARVATPVFTVSVLSFIVFPSRSLMSLPLAPKTRQSLPNTSLIVFE